MRKHKLFLGIAVIVVIAVIIVAVKKGDDKTNVKTMQEISPAEGDITLSVATTGVVQPQNRLEIKPSINGRIEEILVKEGDKVQKGDILVYMSSTERAALVDAARSKGEETRQYWEEVYKQTPIVSPIDGEVIVRAVEPGQTITTNDAVLVLSDRLIVSAQFDETDIGRVKLRQRAVIKLDAYPEVTIKGIVDEIAYESQLVNNVNIYDVDIVPQNVPDYFRSGMSTNVEVIEDEKLGVLTIPVDAVIEEEGKTFVSVKGSSKNKTEKREVVLGLSDEKNVEVIKGLTPDDSIMVYTQAYDPSKKKTKGTNPFMPFRGQRR